MTGVGDTTVVRPAKMGPTRTPVGRQSFYVALDNYEPCPRNDMRGELEWWAADDIRPETAVLVDFPIIGNDPRAVWLLDDGRRVRPFYTAGWTQDHSRIFLHPFPLDHDPDKNGRGLDMSGWALGPRRAYHLKLSRESYRHWDGE